MGNLELRKDNSGRGEIVIYQPDDITRLDVRVENESVLLMLSKRQTGVTAEIRTGRLTETLKQDLAKHNSQYPPIIINQIQNIHDRFLIVDDDVYHIGASLKDLGKKLFAFSKISVPIDL